MKAKEANMKICYISTKSIHTRRWVEHFAERGHEVHLITLSYTKEERTAVPEEVYNILK